MMQTAQQVGSKLLALIIAGVAGVGFVTAATAAGVGAGVDANVGGGAQVAAPDMDQAGGSADAHMSTSGSTNSNAQWQSGATRGAEHMNARDAEMKPSEETALEAIGTATAKGKSKR